MAEQGSWPALLDTLHDALAHALNGRVAGIDGVVQLSRIRGGMDTELLALLEDELARLRGVALAAAHVPRAARDLGPLTVLRDAADAAAAVNGIRRNLSIEVRPAAQSAAVRAAQDDVVRCVLLLVHAVEDAGTAIVIEEGSDERTAVLRVGAAGSAEPDPAAVASAQALAGALGGKVSLEDRVLVLRMPRADADVA